MSFPLEGLRVLDLSRVLAGPFAGRMLSDLGADVVKIEPPEGDITRLWGAQIGGISGYFHQQNAGKRDVSIDLSKAAGVDLLKALVEKADILIENFRPDVMGRLGLDFETLHAINPKLIMLSISGFGSDGPESRRPAYAPVIHAESGLIARQAERSQAAPADITVSLADTNASLHGLVGVLAALHQRQGTGLGQRIEVAMIDATNATDDDMHYFLEGSLHTKAPAGQIFDTSAGTLLISADMRFLWKRLTDVFKLADPTPAGADLDTKIAARRGAIIAFFNERCSDRAEVIEALAAMNLAWGDVRDSRDAREQPTLKHRGSITTVDNRAGGEREIVQSPYRFSSADSGVRGGAPHQGEHNEAVLGQWLGANVADFADALVQIERGDDD